MDANKNRPISIRFCPCSPSAWIKRPRIASLARKTGRTKTFYAREAILAHLEDLKDAFLAVQRIRANERTYSLDEVKRELGPRKKLNK